MATPPNPIGSSQVADLALAKLADAARTQAAATIAAAIIAKSSKVLSIGETMQVLNDVQFSMWQDHNSGVYQAWKKTFDPAKVY